MMLTQMAFHHLFRSKISLYDTSSPEYHYVHYAVCFEFSSWPREELRSYEDAEFLVSSLCLVRNHMKFDSPNTNVLVHDSSGGVRGSALFIIMYELMDKVDESFSDDGSLKKFVEDINVFNMVNQLRKDRANMIDDFNTYKLIFHCLSYYGKNGSSLNTSISRSGNGTCVITENEQRLPSNVEDVIHHADDDNNTFGEYVFEENTLQRHEYQNMIACNENQ